MYRQGNTRLAFWHLQPFSGMIVTMSKALTEEQIAAAAGRRHVAAHLQAIEGNPPTDEQTAMFEMFEREGWSHDRRLAYIKARAEAAAAVHAAE
jgi:hypothetical protein